jgi:hypothetical protein
MLPPLQGLDLFFDPDEGRDGGRGKITFKLFNILNNLKVLLDLRGMK